MPSPAAGGGTRMVEEREGGLRRWSRLKQRAATRRSTEAVAPAEAPLPATVDEDGRQASTTDDVVAKLPSIDSLDKDSDFTPFLADGVPEDIARAAMRKMWLSDPVFAFRDGLDDYDEDFTIIESIAKSLTEGGKEDEDPDTAEETAETETETDTEEDGEEVADGEEGADGEEVADGEEATEAPDEDASGMQAVEATADEADDENSGTPPNAPS